MSGSVDVLVVGGGPAGSTAAMCAARAGMRVVLIEKAMHPRFHVGESFLPRTLELIRSLGLEEDLSRIPRTRKVGASLMFADDAGPMDFFFEDGLLSRGSESFNVERAPFDAMLLHAAARAGADVREGVTVEEIESLQAGDVRVRTSEGMVQARLLMDASGQGTVVGRKLGTRRGIAGFQKVAYFGHLHGIARREEPRGGMPIFAMCEEGWFWLIPLDGGRTSVGAVLDASVARVAGVPARRMLRWACGRCPSVWSLVGEADMSAANRVLADFSYACAPYAGDGYVLVGDSAVFIDPVFSTGVCLGMESGVMAAKLAPEMLAGGARARRAEAEYHAFVDGVSSLYLRLVRGFYAPAFRELFMRGRGPLGVHRAIMSMLAGHVFPRAPLSVRWRWRVFEGLLALHRRVGIVERREGWSLLGAPATNDERPARLEPVRA